MPLGFPLFLDRLAALSLYRTASSKVAKKLSEEGPHRMRIRRVMTLPQIQPAHPSATARWMVKQTRWASWVPVCFA
eukprot:2649509-Amphidinium_carterae.1